MKKLNFLVLLVSVCFFASAQQSANTWITGGIHHRLPNIDYRFEAHPAYANGLIYKAFHDDSKPMFEIEYLKMKNEKTDKIDTLAHGLMREWYSNGQLKHEQNFRLNKFDGTVKSYWLNGNLKRDDVYSNDTLMTGACYDSTGVKVDYFPFAEMPAFKGGDKKLFSFLANNVRYPVEAQKLGIEGRVLVQFVVGKDGKVTDAKIVKNANYYLDIEALRVVNAMPNWIPGKLEGKSVRVKHTLPVNFRLR